MSQPARDSGYTLIEVLVTIVLMGAMMAIAVAGYDRWAAASEQSGTAREIQSLMRQAQQRAVTEGRAMCVKFTSSPARYTLYRGACDDTAKTKVNGPFQVNGSRVGIGSPSFTDSTGGVTFFARGTASPGSVTVTRQGSSKVYTLEVEGLTGRVSLD
ncbi:GspH/FimT family pseudopilin [Nocardioides sp. MAHUQ-72]|uniref:GspH/FimT family pseudopilin n=1 Tax=unclassified Nocardioides TaxID=2615069 RepID=UPI00361F1A4E